MPTRLVHMVIDAAEPARLARFWAAALGWEMTAEWPEVAKARPAVRAARNDIAATAATHQESGRGHVGRSQ
jgi:Glyoxalase-like domain